MLGIKIKELRLLHGLNQIELANELSVSKQCISNWENDNIQPSIEMLVKLSSFFSVSTDFLLGLDTRNFVEVSGLSKKELCHIQLLINDIRNTTKK